MKVLIVDNHPVVSNGCRALLQDRNDIEIHVAESIVDAAAKYTALKPDVAVVDVNLPDGSGYDLTRQLAGDDDAKILIFTMCDGAIYAAHAFEAGAKGYLSKNSDPLQLREAILTIAEGNMFIPDVMLQEVALRKATASPGVVLSARDKQILRLLADGATVLDAASELGVAYKTVLRACARMRESLGADNQLDLIHKALQMNLISPSGAPA